MNEERTLLNGLKEIENHKETNVKSVEVLNI